MSPELFVHLLRHAGLQLDLEGENLRIHGSKAVYTGELRREILARKPELVAVLVAQSPQTAPAALTSNTSASSTGKAAVKPSVLSAATGLGQAARVNSGHDAATTPPRTVIALSMAGAPRWERQMAALMDVTDRISRSSFVALCVERGELLGHRPRRLHLVLADGSAAEVELLFGLDLRSLSDVLRHRPVIVHDGAHCLAEIAQHNGLYLREVRDTFIAAKVLDGGRAKNDPPFQLAAVLERELEIKLPKMSRAKAAMSASEAHIEEARALVQLWNRLSEKLVDAGLAETVQLEFDLIPVVVDMTLAGVRVDKSKWNELVVKARRKVDALTPRVKQQLSAQDLEHGSILRALKKMGLPVDKTDKDTLAPYTHIQAVADLIELRRAESFANSTGPVLLRELNASPDGRVCAQLRQLGTVTGRFTSPRLNLLGLPKSDEARRAFIPAEGCVFVVGDFAACQLRIVAVHAPEAKLLKVFGRKDGDPHRLTASLILQKPESEVTEDERQRAKAVNSGFVFGMGVAAFIAYARAQYNVVFTPEEATLFRAQFFEQYPGIAAWHERVKQDESDGTASAGGRVRYFESSDFCARLASPVQSTEADGVKRAMVRLSFLLPKFAARILLCLHDELLVEAPLKFAAQVRDLVEREMREAMAELVPEVAIRVDMSIRSSWAKCDELTIPTGIATPQTNPGAGQS